MLDVEVDSLLGILRDEVGVDEGRVCEASDHLTIKRQVTLTTLLRVADVEE